MIRNLLPCIATVILLFAAAPAQAHVELEGEAAQANAPFVAAFHVGHGCSGSPTVRLRIEIPPGVAEVEPQPKAGWSIVTESGPYESPVTSGGRTFQEGVKQVIWSGLLPAHKTATFPMKAKLAADAQPGQKLVFPVLQECEKGLERWIDLDDQSDHPAPYLTIEPKTR
jgi:uncharacterized protein YcnI